MADQIELEDLAGHTGAGCVHDKHRAILQACRDWRRGAPAAAAFNDLKTRLESACPGVTWNLSRIVKVLRAWTEEA